jgi:hypothetical protein
MSKTWEHYQIAAHHHERAAYQFKEAAKYHEAEEQERAAHLAYLAHGHAQHATVHAAAAAKLHVGQCDILAIPGIGSSSKKNMHGKSTGDSRPRLVPSNQETHHVTETSRTSRGIA